MSDNTGRLFQQAQKKRFFDHKQDQKIHAPENIVPGCPVPKAGQEPYHGKVEISSRFSLPVAAERNIDILTEPGGKRHMPTPPEFGDAP